MNFESHNPETPRLPSPEERKAIAERLELHLFEAAVTSFNRVVMRIPLRGVPTLTVYCEADKELDIFPKLPPVFEGFPTTTLVIGSTKGPREETE